MVTSYYDNINEVDGEWQHYPEVVISEGIHAIYVNSIPGENEKYTYLILYSEKESKVIKTLDPNYDTWIYAIDAKVKKGEIEELKVRLVNPPEPFNLKYTIIEYENQNGKLVKTRNYDKE